MFTGGSRFKDSAPGLDSHWRSIILFGRNVASYKFALAKALIELSSRSDPFVTLEELADPFSRHLCEHLRSVERQSTSGSSRFLDSCRAFNAGDLPHDDLLAATVKLGFVNVIDAFHIVNHGEIAVRFFTDERTSRRKGVRSTDELSTLRTTVQWRNLEPEVEARWRLVEAAWELNLPREALTVKHDPELLTLFPDKVALRRTSITGSRDALNGYQRGKCFYCFADIAVDAGAHELADVDHFFPHVLKRFGIAGPVDGVWNLVLACRDCKRGVAGKFGRLPALRYLARLWRRNNHLIGSRHPLRDTLLQQTGRTEATRHSFFQSTYNEARSVLIHTWSPQYEFEPAF